MPAKPTSRYAVLIEAIFTAKYQAGATRVDFEREDIVHFAEQRGIRLPKNLGDLIYSFRYRRELPAAIQQTAEQGQHWVILPAGIGKYRFAQVRMATLLPNPDLAITRIPDATPGLVARYALTDEQALLAKVRYNRLVDIFTGVACTSLQNHLRTTVPDMGQVEIDELYVGVDRRGAQYVFPLQAKGGADKLGIVQIEQDLAVCAHKFPDLICRPIATQFMENQVIAILEFVAADDGLRISGEKHYQLVPHDQVTGDDLRAYRHGSVDQ